MAEQQHKYTGILLLVFALLVLLGAIFFTVAQSKVTSTDEYKAGNTKLNNAKNDLLFAYILGYIAAGLGLILAVLYFGHIAWGIKSEIPHLIVFILLFLLVIVSGIFGFIALSNISDSNASDKKGAENWIWASLVAGLIGIIVLIISGAWRAQYRSTKGAVDKAVKSFTSPSGSAGAQYSQLAASQAACRAASPQVVPQTSQTVTYTYVPPSGSFGMQQVIT